jgi:CBS domain-containing protein
VAIRGSPHRDADPNRQEPFIMSIAEICQRHVITIDATATLREAATQMREHHVGALVVTAETAGQNQVVGVITDRDLAIEVLARDLSPADVHVAQVASRRLVAVPTNASLGEAAAMMKDAGVRRLLVTGDGGQLVGFVTADDLLDALAGPLGSLAGAVRSGIARETSERSTIAPPRFRPAFLPHGTPGMQEPVRTSLGR